MQESHSGYRDHCRGDLIHNLRSAGFREVWYAFNEVGHVRLAVFNEADCPIIRLQREVGQAAVQCLELSPVARIAAYSRGRRSGHPEVESMIV